VAARAKLYYSSKETALALEAQRRSFKVQQATFAWLIHLKKVYKKVCSKE